MKSMIILFMPDEKKYTFLCHFCGVRVKEFLWFSKNAFKKWKEKLKCDDIILKNIQATKAKNYFLVFYSVYNLKVDFERVEQIGKTIESDLIQFKFKGDLDIKNPMVSFEKVKVAYVDLYK